MIYFLLFLSICSIAANILLIWYARKLISQCYIASESASEIFARLDAYKKHLNDVYSLKLFYGDRNLKEILEHTTNLIDFLKQFEGIYSFTQPELEKILLEEDEQKNEETS